MNDKKTLYITIAAIIALIAIFFFARKTEVDTPITPVSTVGTLSNLEAGTPPWPTEFTHLRERLASIGLPALTAEGTVLHIHQHLEISVNGQSVEVPTHIGIDQNEQFISPIHVHDTTGIIHVESPTVQTFTLGQFFDVWGLSFSQTNIGGLKTDSTHVLQLYVNGTLYEGDPRALALDAHQEFFLFYGTKDQLPKSIPSTYTFPAGY